jgi:hypothetical protein
VDELGIRHTGVGLKKNAIHLKQRLTKGVEEIEYLHMPNHTEQTEG